MEECEEIFTRIYQEGNWKKDSLGKGTSGPGSTLPEGFPFVFLLNLFLSTHTIQSVVDVGCGDWVLARHICWGSRNYIGIDIVKTLIETNTMNYSSSSIDFALLDITQKTLPPADLLICKDVFIHLPLKDIFFCLNQLQHFKHAILINDIDPSNPLQNGEISTGKFRPLDLTLPPFNLCPNDQTTYISGCTTKHVLFFDFNSSNTQT